MAEKKAAAKKAAPKKEAPTKVGRPKEVGKLLERSLRASELSLLTAATKRTGMGLDAAVTALVRSRLADRSGPITLSVLLKRFS
jgi:hypothetical protein